MDAASRSQVETDAGPDPRRADAAARVLIVGSGFAGLWTALGAARRLDELAVPQGRVEITVLSAHPFHDIRVRNYEDDLSACRIPLAELLDPVGVTHVTAEVSQIDADTRTLATSAGATH